MTIRNDEWEIDDQTTVMGYDEDGNEVACFKSPTQMLMSEHNSFVMDSENGGGQNG